MIDDAGGAWSVVVPTVGRPSLAVTVRTLLEAGCRDIVVVDDRPPTTAPLPFVADERAAGVVRVVASAGRGPAAARNVGVAWTATPWVVVVDDDVVVDPDWALALADDLRDASPVTAAVQARISVPLPVGRAATDWERHTARLATTTGITADLAIRRAAFEEVGGFDEGFRRAYREDSDLLLRLEDAGWVWTVGTRLTMHPPRPSGALASVRVERGNADDVRMARKHGRGFRRRLDEHGRWRVAHRVTTALLLGGGAAALTGHRRSAAVLLGGWSASTLTLAAVRIAPGPRTRAEVGRMLVTTPLLPIAATWYQLVGAWRLRTG